MMIKALVILGKEAVNRYDETQKVPTKEWLSKNGGIVDTKEFKTRAEYDAYCQWLNDANGWQEILVFPPMGKQQDCACCEQWRFAADKEKHIHYCPACGKQFKEKVQIEFGSVTFRDKIYLTRTIDIPGYMDAAVISVEELNDLIRDGQANDVSPQSEQLEAIDKGIFFFVSKQELKLPNKELAKLVINYLEGK